MTAEDTTGAAGEVERITKAVAGWTKTYLRNNSARKAVRMRVRSVCHSPRMNAVMTCDVFPK